MAVKTIWCRQEKTTLDKPSSKRWRCPDCKQRFTVCSKRIDGDVYYWGPPHKKRAK